MNYYGVVYKDKGKMYYFNGHDLRIPNNVTVIVETSRGEQFGRVVKRLSNEDLVKIDEDLKNIIRIATKRDYENYLQNCKDATLALKKAQRLSDELGLKMRFVDSDFTFDRRQLLFSFYADERVDFRELAKRLASIYKTRIELRQIGARDKASLCGGIGVCGKPLCCVSFLQHLDTVSINMAKDQNLSLNPTKINGCCGRLLCCLAYEEDEYVTCSKGMPSVGDRITLGNDMGVVVSIDILRRRYKLLVGDEIREVRLDEKVS